MMGRVDASVRRHDVSCWHEREVFPCPLSHRSWSISGRNAGNRGIDAPDPRSGSRAGWSTRGWLEFPAGLSGPTFFPTWYDRKDFVRGCLAGFVQREKLKQHKEPAQ
jgi:hypothetical protein